MSSFTFFSLRLRGELFLFFGFLWVLAGCTASATANGEPQPPEILYGHDLCDSCGMVIDDPRFAAATLLKNDETRKFDDLGDMMIYHMEHPDLQVVAWFVHDAVGEHWIRAETAFFVVNLKQASPMGHGSLAFEDEPAAQEYAAEYEGEVVNFDEFKLHIHIHEHS